MAPTDEARIPLRLPLWLHQIVEYLLGFLLILQSISAGADVYIVAAAGGVLIILAATTDAACGLFRWTPPRLHQMLDLVAIVLLAVSPFVVGTSDPFAIFLCVTAAIVLAWLNRHTQWIRPVKPAPARPARPTPAPDRPASPAATPPPLAESMGARARSLGETASNVRRYGPRVLGRVVGRAQAARAAGSGSATRPDGRAEPGDGLEPGGTTGDDGPAS